MIILLDKFCFVKKGAAKNAKLLNQEESVHCTSQLQQPTSDEIIKATQIFHKNKAERT